METIDYIRQTAAFLMEAHHPVQALDMAEHYSRKAFESGDLAHHQFWKFVFDDIEENIELASATLDSLLGKELV